MKIEELNLDERVERAVENFMAGYGCCQSVVAAFSDLYGLDETMAKRIAAGFGGGVGRMRMMCGAVSGIVMLVGLDCGQTEGSDREGKSACYKVVQELLAQSQAENGSLICAVGQLLQPRSALDGGRLGPCLLGSTGCVQSTVYVLDGAIGLAGDDFFR